MKKPFKTGDLAYTFVPGAPSLSPCIFVAGPNDGLCQVMLLFGESAFKIRYVSKGFVYPYGMKTRNKDEHEQESG